MIAKVVAEDIVSLNTLINSAYRGEFSKKGWTTEAHLLEGSRTTEVELLGIIQDASHTILKYSDNGKIIGCVLLKVKANELYLGMLTVSPDLQNSGIGKKLLRQAEVFAVEMQLPKIVMTVITVRVELIAWYKRNGYVDTGAREPFPVSDVFNPTTKEPLEFMVLEKVIT
jgi:ribosomal protein S18 acetylase RimI-like enzyme